METLVWIGIVLVVMIIASIQSQRENRRRTRARLEDEFNNPIKRELQYDTYENLKAYFYDNSGDNFIDDDTWTDLNMDSMFMEINNTNSSVGREYLFAMLRKPNTDMDALKEIDYLAEKFKENTNERINIQEDFVKMGYIGIGSVFTSIKELQNYVVRSNLKHYLMFIFGVASIGIIMFVNAEIGLMLCLMALFISILTYFKEKAVIEPYLNCVKLLVRMITTAGNAASKNIDYLEKYNKILRRNLEKTKKIPQNMYLVTTGGDMSGSIGEVIMEYVRILTHVDLIKFNNSIRLINENYDAIMEIYEVLGYIESVIAISAYRNKLPYWNTPQLSKGDAYNAKNLYHPLLEAPVANSINTKECILLTGSNASGKSTFLKSVAINALLSQTIATSTSESYQGDFYKIISSMSHRDDIINGDSYYMVEIKALKRILDLSANSELKVLCFLDEVLRGTNTVERIAASTQILKCFAERNTLCFAATHDIELTKLLEKHYINYHFDESFINEDVKYNYTLCEGPAVTRNAIKLLEKTGYDRELIKSANEMTKIFETTGVWK